MYRSMPERSEEGDGGPISFVSVEVGTLLDAEEAPTSKSIKDTQLDEEYQN
jgi:hypothetical protein